MRNLRLAKIVDQDGNFRPKRYRIVGEVPKFPKTKKPDLSGRGFGQFCKKGGISQF